MKRKLFSKLLIGIFFNILIYPTNYYISKTASGGSNNGTTWLNAWTSISNINWSIIQPGDKIIISGGTDSLVYNESLTIGKSGSQSGVITISKSYESGHNGRVILKPTSGNGILIDGKSFIVVRGLEVENQSGNSNHNVYVDNCSYVTIDSMYLRPNARGVFMQECEDGIVISRNKIVTITFTTNQTDCIYSQRNRQISVYGNYLEVRNSESNGHNDCFQSYQDGKDATNSNKNTVTFYNNVLFQNNNKQSNSSTTMPTYGWGWFTYYNNLIVQPNSYVMGLGVQQNPDGSTNMKARIWNNTFIAGSVQDKSIYFRYMKSIDTIDVANNIIYTSYGYGSVKIEDSPNLNVRRWENNSYYSINSNWGGQVIKLNGAWKTFSQWRALGYDLNGRNQNPGMINPTISTGGLGNYSLLENSEVKDQGISLTTYFNYDNINTLRPQGNAWDIGAFEYFIPQSLTLQLNAKVLLEGAFLDNQMNNHLNLLGYLPGNQPYNQSPWNYSGTESMQSIPSDMVDWVLIELRTSTDETSSVYKAAAVILQNGIITETDGVSPVTLNGLSAGDYYLVVYHRNHLPIISSSAINFSSSITNYDFTTSMDKAFGLEPMKEIGVGVFGMIAGDGDGNGGVTISDRNLTWQLQNGNLGYLSGDFSLDGGVTIKDCNQYWNNNNGRASQVP